METGNLLVKTIELPTMETGNLLVKTIELPRRFARRLLQGSIFCTTVIVIFLIVILFDIIFRV